MNAAVFQFQTGAIKRKSSNIPCRLLSCCFNSKLVRLKAFTRLCSSLRNSSFQFQTGAIKRCHKTHATIASRPCFNSKLVRLKVNAAFHVVGCIWFQFQTGAIKRACSVVLREVLESFNSKLVRLKVEHIWYGRASLSVSIPNWCD